MQDLLDILCCPETHQPLKIAEANLITEVNAKIKAGQATNRGGKPVAEPIDSAFVREDRKYLYPIRNDIPVLLVDEAIPL